MAAPTASYYEEQATALAEPLGGFQAQSWLGRRVCSAQSICFETDGSTYTLRY